MIKPSGGLCFSIFMLSLLPLKGQRLEGRLHDFQTKDQPATARERISMIGYESRILSLEEILKLKEDIFLTQKPVELDEVKVRAVHSERKVGACSVNLRSGWSGWGGMFIRKGFEMGTRINLGDQPVKIKSRHVPDYSGIKPTP